MLSQAKRHQRPCLLMHAAQHVRLDVRWMAEGTVFCSRSTARGENCGLDATISGGQGKETFLGHNSSSLIFLAPYRTHI